MTRNWRRFRVRPRHVSTKDLDKLLRAYAQVADRVAQIEFEAKVTRITLEDVTIKLAMYFQEGEPGENSQTAKPPFLPRRRTGALWEHPAANIIAALDPVNDVFTHEPL